MDRSNLVVLHGRVSSEPRVRSLPSGSTLTQLDVTTRSDSGTWSVPVAIFDVAVDAAADDDVVVVGRVRRRFFRAGGVTQSRTEVVAERVGTPAREAYAYQRGARGVATWWIKELALRLAPPLATSVWTYHGAALCRPAA